MISRRILTGAVAALCLLGAGQVQGQPPAPAAGRGGPPPAPAPLTQGGPIIETKLGKLQGGSAEGVNAYRGIPFAAPPVGDLRWRDPRPAAAWQGVRAATSYSPACNQAEDCLYLNVWTPPDAKPGAKLPVLVWIHGGAFINGSGAGVDGTQFAKKGVVVVSVNYRLGRMGFFGHPALTAENGGVVGNYGLADNGASLKWVNQNIAAFGGDPGNVTISGESAGAILVNLLMLAPPAQGLFHKAIAESGFGRRGLYPVHAANAPRTGEQVGLAFAQKAGVSGTDAAAAKALRALPFTAFANPPGVGQPDQPTPMIDGKWVAGGILDGFEAGREARVPYLVGGNSNEASLYRGVMKTEDEYARIARNDAFAAAFDPEKSGNTERMVARFVTDQRISEPDRALAREHSKRAPTFVYHFSYVPAAQRASALGAPHGGEISYAFNTLRGTPDEEGKAVAAAMNSYWAAFAKSGDPDSAGGPRWAKWDAATEPLMEFPSSGKPIAQTHFNKARLDWVEKVQPARLAFER